MSEISQNLGTQEDQIDYSCINEKNVNLNTDYPTKNYNKKEFRDMIYIIKFGGEKEKSLHQISIELGYSSGRIQQICNHFEKYFPKTAKKQAEMWNKIQDKIYSLNRKIKEGDDKNGEQAEK